MREQSIDPSAADQSKPLVFKTGGMVMFAGVWLLLLGLAMTAIALFLALWTPAGEAPLWLRVGILVLAAIPLAAAAIGLLLTFGGECITLDAAARQVRVAHGRWWTWKRETFALDTFHAVEVRRQSATVGVSDHHGGQPTYPVRLLAVDDEVELANVSNYRKARTTAEQVANFAGLRLHESTEQETVIREAGTLDESLAQRAKRLGQTAEWPALPEDSRIEVLQFGGQTTIVLPRPHGKLFGEGVLSVAFLLLLYGGALGSLAYFGRTWLSDFGANAKSGVWPVVIWAVPIIPVVYILGFGAILLSVCERIVISARSFSRVWRFPVGSWTRRMPVGRIEELLSNTEAVMLRTDRTTCRVGFALTRQERRWLREAIRCLLVNGPDVQTKGRP